MYVCLVVLYKDKTTGCLKFSSLNIIHGLLLLMPLMHVVKLLITNYLKHNKID